jgi:phage tail protein X
MRHLLLLALLLPACGPASTTAPTPGSVVSAFYRATIGTASYGPPTPAELTVLAPMLSDTLRALLRAARELHDSDLARAPDEKPAFADGSLYSSLFEGPTTATVVADSARGTGHAVSVQLTYSGATPPVTWTDVALVIEAGDHFVIDDIEYHGTWDFANRGTLRQMLTDALTPASPAGAP